ncbi:MAG: hypothetical protein COT71_00025 [Candidatus Andersenbacteria bacterium CG10_big_fil_rev_8_21_14_0_10_54_11]|uniref:NodB homology domain-containing protein n=1 Tax=Candidatus Andersenbacteria bacterium CG10_big_fil_rev_8_21_14_0_10_54_11 TaxID=1974485 RepID=A0A2M6X0N0_9BACT|nr:MAG: hypothetical protein COT71_00025 [Candidatus Andersenbacteria bacterium CG10_big_fil_rev_8_21_14_0_10_54_11]
MTRGAVTLVFDDGYEHIYRDVLPLLDAAGIPAVFAVPIDPSPDAAPAAAPLRSWQHWQQLNPRHELAAHGISHSNLTTLSAAELNTELAIPAAQLKATTLVYPGGAHNEEVTAAARAHYFAARTVKKGTAALPPHDPYHLPAFDFTQDSFSLTRANWLAVQVCLANRWLIETYHVVSDYITAPKHRVPLRDFLRHLTLLQRLPIRIATIREIIAPPQEDAGKHKPHSSTSRY